MKPVYESIIDFKAPLSVVSTALNGLFVMPGALTEVREQYSFDVMKDIGSKEAGELKDLYSNGFSYAKRVELQLTALSENETRVAYKFERKKQTSLLIVTLFIQIVIAVLMGIGFGSSANSFNSTPIVVGGIAFLITMLVLSFLPLLAIHNVSDVRVDKIMTQTFAERLNSYIAIVQKNQRK